jgi:hypothetical protein
MMDGADFGWVALADQPGVSEKTLGIFTERRAQSGFYRVDAGATLHALGRAVYVAYRGEGSVNGTPLRPFTTVFLDHGEDAVITATSEVELIHFGLPDLRDLAAQPEMTAVAAE